MTDKPKARIWKDHQVASYLGFSIQQFRKKQAKLLKEGFPAKDDLLEGFDSVRVERWFDGRTEGQRAPQKSVGEILATRTRNLKNGQKIR